MKKLLTSLLLLSFQIPSVFAITTEKGCVHPFADVEGHWAEESICQLFEDGVVSGYSEKTFSPNSEITRAEFVKIFVQSLSYSIYPVQSAAFSDTATNEWFYAVVSFAHSKGFVTGYSDGSFHPNSSITRAEAVKLLVNASGYSSADTTELQHQFYDVNPQDWYATSLAIALENNIVQGYGDGSFRPNNPITRAEACEMLVRALKSVLK